MFLHTKDSKSKLEPKNLPKNTEKLILCFVKYIANMCGNELKKMGP